MALPTLESLTDTLDAQTVGLLGDPISYKVGDTAAVSINAFVDHTDKTEAFAGNQITAQDIVVDVRKIDIPTVSTTDVVTLPRTGLTYSPKDWLNSPCGRFWKILLKLVR